MIIVLVIDYLTKYAYDTYYAEIGCQIKSEGGKDSKSFIISLYLRAFDF
jgi:hypothetical protein